LTRIVFESLDQLKDWITDHVSPGYYECFVTELNEIIFAPTKSTKTLRHSYMRFSKYSTLEDLTKALKESMNIRVYKVKSYDWASDRMIGAGYTE